MNISASTSSLAAQQRPDAATLFKRTDANGDGKITKDELTTALKDAPQKADGNTGPNADDLFSKLDADGDGEITETEHEAGLQQMEGGHGGPPPSGTASSSTMVDSLKKLLEALQQQETSSASATSDTEDATTTATADADAAAASKNSGSDIEALIKTLVAELKQNSETSGVLRAVA